MSLTSRFGISLTVGLLLSLSTPFIIPAISHNSRFTTAQAQTQPTAFSDVPTDYWAHDYIAGLAKSNIISGFGDGTFRPNEPVTRAQFAAILRKAFLQSQPTTAQPFTDVPSKYWAADAIYAARSAGFLSGYPGNKFGPNDFITRENALISLAKGLKYAESSSDVLSAYQDVDSISNYALPGVRSAAQAGLIINYPDVDRVSPRSPGSRADVAAFVYQALVKAGRAEPLVARAAADWQSNPVVTLSAKSERMSLSQTGQQLASVTPDGASFQIWNTQTGKLMREIKAPDGTRFDNISIAHDGKRVAVIAENLSTYAMTLFLWPSATGEQIWQKPLDIDQNQLRDRRSSYTPTVQVAFTPNDSQIVTQLILDTTVDGFKNNQLRFQSAATGEAVQFLDYSGRENAQLQKIAFSPDGQFFASASFEISGGTESRVDIWRLNQDGRFEPFRTLPIPKYTNLFDMVFANNGTLHTSTLSDLDTTPAGARRDIWSLQTDDSLSRTDYTAWDRTGAITRLSPDNEYYFLFGYGVGSRLTNAQTGEQRSLDASYINTAAVFSDDGNYLAIASTEDISIFVKKTASNP